MLNKVVGNKANIASAQQKAAAPSANTAAVITLAAPATGRNVVHGVQWSYSDIPTAGRLTVSGLNGGVTWDITITAGGPGGFGFMLVGADLGSIVLTLAAGGGTVAGKLNAQTSVELE